MPVTVRIIYKKNICLENFLIKIKITYDDDHDDDLHGGPNDDYDANHDVVVHRYLLELYDDFHCGVHDLQTKK